MKEIAYRDSLFRGNIYRSIDIAASGLSAQRRRMDAISSNIANMSVTNADGNGNPYLRRQVTMHPDPQRRFDVVLQDAQLNLKRTSSSHMPTPDYLSRKFNETQLVDTEEIEIPNMKKNVVYDPAHPDADAEGYVTYPDIDIVMEMTNLMIANRMFEANTTVINSAKQMIMKSLEI